MKTLILILTTILAVSLTKQASAHNCATESNLMVVKFHADWCGACKAIEPDFKALPGELKDATVKFYKFDLTNEETKNASTNLAKELGLLEIYNANQKTGFILVIDSKTGEIKETLTRNDNVHDMVKKINANK